MSYEYPLPFKWQSTYFGIESDTVPVLDRYDFEDCCEKVTKDIYSGVIYGGNWFDLLNDCHCVWVKSLGENRHSAPGRNPEVDAFVVDRVDLLLEALSLCWAMRVQDFTKEWNDDIAPDENLRLALALLHYQFSAIKQAFYYVYDEKVQEGLHGTSEMLGAHEKAIKLALSGHHFGIHSWCNIPEQDLAMRRLFCHAGWAAEQASLTIPGSPVVDIF